MAFIDFKEIPEDCLESVLKSHVRRLARSLQWEYYHTHDSRKSEPGFPDVVLVRDKRLIFAELKRQKELCTNDQIRWLTKLAICDTEVYVWRPLNWNDRGILNLLL